VNVNFGPILGGFLNGAVSKIEKNPAFRKKKISEIEKNSRNKFSLNEVSLTPFNTDHYKILIYFISWLLKVGFNLFIRRAERSKSITKYQYMFFRFQQRIHFAAYNMMYSHSIFLSIRCILHLKPLKDIDGYYTFEKLVAFLVFYLFIFDSIEMIKKALTPV